MGIFDGVRRFLTPGDFQEAAAESAMQMDKFSPGVPIRPADGYSRAPRAHDFLTGYNIAARPRRNERVSFQTLQGIIEAYDVAQMAITHRIDSVRSLDWYLEPIEGVSGDTSEMMAYAKSILKSPDRELPFRAWLSKFLWDVLAYDAGTLYRIRNNAGKVIGLKVVDGTSIAPLIDYHGGRPTGDAPAYVQFAQGVPWNWLTQDDIIYIPFRPMPNTPYGKSPIESVLLNANTDLRFQNYFLARFTEGTVPEGFAVSPDSWSPDQIADFQQAWDAIMYGDDSKKHQIKWVPGGTSFEWTRENTFDSEFSLFMMRKTAAAYHVTPNDLGFTETVNLASSETQLDVQFRIGDLPLIQHVQEILSDFIQNDLGLPIRFLFNTGQGKDDKMLTASIHDMYIKNGVLSVSEVRQEVYGLVEPDGVAVPRFLMGGQGPIPLNVIRAGSGTTDPDTGSPMGNNNVEATQYDVAQGLATDITPKGGAEGTPGNTTADARNAAYGTSALRQESLGKEAATAGITTATGVVGNPMLSDEDEEDEDSRKESSKAEDMVAKELAQFRRFVKARKKAGKWRDFKFDAISEDDAKRLNTAARIEAEPLDETASLVMRAADTGRVLMIQRWLDPADPHAGMLEFPGGHLEDGEDFADAAVREWMEEVGQELPEGKMRYGWRNFKGDHEAYIYEIASEDLVVPRAKHDSNIANPDDPNDPEEVKAEPIMWIDVPSIHKNPLVRPEILHDYAKIEMSLGDKSFLAKGWDPELHPRDEHGRFGETGGLDARPASFADLPKAQGEEENFIVAGYAGTSDSMAINALARGEKVGMPYYSLDDVNALHDKSEALQNLIDSKPPLAENMTFERYTDTGALGSLGDMDSEGKWVTPPKEWVGNVLVNKGFTSMSAYTGAGGTPATNYNAQSSDVKFVITAPAGTKGIAGVESENEYIVGKGAELAITKVSFDDGGAVVEATITGQK